MNEYNTNPKPYGCGRHSAAGESIEKESKERARGLCYDHKALSSNWFRSDLWGFGKSPQTCHSHDSGIDKELKLYTTLIICNLSRIR